jgi:hypothetical protein
MLSRRELITAGVAGSLSATPGTEASTLVAGEQQADREGQREIARMIQALERTLNSAMLNSSLSHGFVPKLRDSMEQFLRANSKFPDFIDVGAAVFFDLYDWHVKHRQQLTVTRVAEGRYAMQFMFTSLVLRPEQDRNYIGVPTDRV